MECERSTRGIWVLMYQAPFITQKLFTRKKFASLPQLGCEEPGSFNFTCSAWKQGPAVKQLSAPGPTPGLS